MIDLETARLTLHAVDVAQARRIRDRAPGGADAAWAPDYPFEGDLAALGAFLRAAGQFGDQRPFGYYQIIRRADGLAVGGIGFKGPPAIGTVEIGYGLVPSARGHGYAAEAVLALLALARDHGAVKVLADTTPENVASQRTLERAGFRRIRPDAQLFYYESRIDGPS